MKPRLYERRPGQLMAFMMEPEANVLAETPVAFANADGGTILIGVDEEGRPTDQVYADEVEAALRAAVQECRPPVEVRRHQATAELIELMPRYEVTAAVMAGHGGEK